MTCTVHHANHQGFRQSQAPRSIPKRGAFQVPSWGHKLIPVFGDEPLYRRLRKLSDREGALAHASSLTDLARTLEHNVVDCAVVQLAAIRPEDAQRHFRNLWLPRFTFVPLVLVLQAPYVSDMRIAVGIARYSAADLVVVGEEENGAEFQQVMRDVILSSRTVALVNALEGSDRRMPPAARGALLRCFTQPSRFPSGDLIAADAFMARRTLDRWLGRAGMSGSGEVLLAARLHFAATLEGQLYVAREEAATGAGFRDVRRLEEAARRLLGTSADRLAALAGSPEGLRALIVSALRPES